MIKYSDAYVSILVKGLLHPGEQFLSACAVRYQSFWSFGIPLFKHSYLLVATTHRLVAVDHRKGFLYDRLDRADTYAWSDVGEVKLAGLLSKKVVVNDRSGRTILRGKVSGLFGPMPNNGTSARTLVQAWQQMAQLPAAAQYGTLPHYAAA